MSGRGKESVWVELEYGENIGRVRLCRPKVRHAVTVLRLPGGTRTSFHTCLPLATRRGRLGEGEREKRG